MHGGYAHRTQGRFTQWTPALLFAGGRLGAWYDVSDLSTMWQDSAATTPAAVDQPVGRILDKSGNGVTLTQSTGSARPTLRNSGAFYWLEFSGAQVLNAASNTLFKFLHFPDNGAYATVAARAGTVADPNAAMAFFGNNGLTTTQNGAALFHDTRNGTRDNQLVTLSATSNNAMYNGATAAGTALANTDLTFSLSEPLRAVGGDATLYVDNVAQATISRTTSPSNVNATNAMQLGASGAGTFFFTGRIYQMFLYDAVPNSTDRNALETFMQAKMP